MPARPREPQTPRPRVRSTHPIAPKPGRPHREPHEHRQPTGRRTLRQPLQKPRKLSPMISRSFSIAMSLSPRFVSNSSP